jgi:hypothetical protein
MNGQDKPREPGLNPKTEGIGEQEPEQKPDSKTDVPHGLTPLGLAAAEVLNASRELAYLSLRLEAAFQMLMNPTKFVVVPNQKPGEKQDV